MMASRPRIWGGALLLGSGLVAACTGVQLDAILVGNGSSGSVSGSGAVASGATASASGGGVSGSGASGSSGSVTLTSEKRGLAYGYNSAADLRALTVESRGPSGTGGIWWWLNWTAFPDNSLGPDAASTAASLGVEYIPMVYNLASIDPTTLGKQIPPGSRYLLTFNVANFTSQANVDPFAAAKAWPQIEAFANTYNPPLKLVSPTVDYCTSGCVANYSDPFVWLHDFMNACSACRIDYIGVRTHRCDSMDLEMDLAQYETYEKPIWITELWCDQSSTPDAGSEQDYMTAAIPSLDMDPRVFRYGWYTGRPRPAPDGTVGTDTYDVLGPDAGQVSALGACYLQGACGDAGSP
jgi:Glycosyl hydrolase catalytic core